MRFATRMLSYLDQKEVERGVTSNTIGTMSVIDLLHQWNVLPSETMLHELRVSGRCPSPVSTDAGTDNAALEEQEGSTDAVDAADGADIMVGLANDLDNLKVLLPPRPPRLCSNNLS